MTKIANLQKDIIDRVVTGYALDENFDISLAGDMEQCFDAHRVCLYETVFVATLERTEACQIETLFLDAGTVEETTWWVD